MNDSYASSFMDNRNPIPISTVIIPDISTYIKLSPISFTTISPSQDIINAPAPKIYKNTNGAYYISVQSLGLLVKDSSTYITTSGSINIVAKIKASVYYSLIALYYSPGNTAYTGLVDSFINNYPVNTMSVKGASTVGITFTPFSKHVTWLYLMARAQWLDNELKQLS